MLGKLIVQAHTRDEAIEHLAAALDRLIILGIPTNRRLLAACLRHPEFRAGRALIPFIAQHGESLRARLAQQEAKLLHSAARRAVAPRRDTVPGPVARPLRVRHRGAAIDVDASAAQESAGHFIAARTQGDHWHLLCDGIDLFVEDISTHPAKRGGAAAADELRAPFNGKVIALDASPGARVVKGQTLLVIESMKLEHALSAARDGVVASVHITAGEQAATSQVLVRFEAIA
jgi:3-methylcrotonyl-CoA carboxylase alpha subunit/geranyl-CoA carboxylase alpha subunit